MLYIFNYSGALLEPQSLKMKIIFLAAILLALGIAPKSALAGSWPPIWHKLLRSCDAIEDTGHIALMDQAGCFQLSSWSNGQGSENIINSPVSVKITKIVSSNEYANKWIVRAEISNSSDQTVKELDIQMHAPGDELVSLGAPGVIMPGRTVTTSTELIGNGGESPKYGKLKMDFGLAKLEDGNIIEVAFQDTRTYRAPNTVRSRTIRSSKAKGTFQ